MAENLGSIRAEIVLKIDELQKGAKKATKVTKDMASDMNKKFTSMKDKIKESFDNMGKAAKKASDEIKESMSGLKKKLEKEFDSMEDLAESAGEGLSGAGALITGSLLAMTAGFKDTEATMRKFEAQTGLTGKELKKFQKAIDETYLKGYGEDLSEVTDAYQKYQRTLKLSSKATQELVEGSFILRDLYEYEIEDTLRASSGLIQNFGITGKKALDIITESARLSGDKAEDLIDTFSEYSQTFSDLGFTAEEFAGMLVKGLQSGQWNTDQLADATKEFGIKLLELAKNGDKSLKSVIDNSELYKKIVKGLKDGTMTTADVMEIVNGKLKKSKDNLSKNELGVALYGSMWEDVGGDIITTLTDSGMALKNFDNANKKAGQTMDGNNVTMEQVTRQFKKLTDSIGKELAPYLSKIILKISEVLSKLLDFAKANPVITKIIAVVGALVGIISSILGVVILVYPYIQTAITVFGALGSTISGIAAAVGGFIAAIGALPIIIGVAIVALVVLIILKWTEIKEFTISIWNSIVEFFKSLPETLMNLWTDFTTWLGELFSSFGKKCSEIWTSILDFIKSIPGKLYDFFTGTLPFFIFWVIGRFVKLQIELYKIIFNFFTKTLPKLVKKGLDLVIKFFTQILPQALKQFALFVVKLIIKALELRTKLINYIKQAVDGVINWFKKLPGRIASLAGSMYAKALTLGKKAVDGIKSGIKSLPGAIYKIVSNAIKGIGKLGSAAWKALKKIGNSMWTGFKKGLGISSPSYIEEAIFDIQDASNKMTDVLRSDFRKLSNMPQVESFVNRANRTNEVLKNIRNIQNFNAPVVSVSGNNENYVTGNNISKDLYNDVYKKLRQGGTS